MSIDRARPVLPLALLFALGSRLGAVDIDGILSQSGGTFAPSGVALVVTTTPVKDPQMALDPSVFIASATVSLISGSTPYSFSGLPFFGASTNYYLYSFRDYNFDTFPNNTEPMGGYGPFPFNDPAGKVTASSGLDVFNGVSFTLYPRGEIQGTLTNNSAQPGQRLVVQATPIPYHEDKLQRVVLSTGAGGSYSLGGLVPGLSYLAEAFVDTQMDGETGSYNPDPFEDKGFLGPFSITESSVQIANVAISSGIVAGPPNHIRLLGPNNSWHQVIASGTASASLQVSVRDFNDSPTTVGGLVSVIFQGYNASGTFAPLNGLGSPLAGTAIGAGQSLSTPFQFLHRSTGPVTLQAKALDYPTFGQYRYAYYSFDVLGEGQGFSSVNARTTSQSSTSTATSVIISPDRDGVNDGAVLSCVSPAGAGSWEVVISSEPAFGTGVVRRLNNTGTGGASWYGDGLQGRTVPNGVYFARFQTEGQGLISSTVTISVQTSGIKGLVKDSGTSTPLANVSVQVFGLGGGGYGITGADGVFEVNGLAAGQSYSLQFAKPGYAQMSTSTVTTPGTINLGNLLMDQGAKLEFSVSVASGPSRHVYGRVFARTADYRSTAYGTLHLAPGSLATDNGLPNSDPNFSALTTLNVLPNTSYLLGVDLPEYGQVSLGTQVSPAAGSSVLVSTTVVRKGNLSGLVSFPSALSTPNDGEWVSVDAVPGGVSSQPVGWGGVFVPNGQSTGTFQLFGVDAGSYTLRASARGFVVSTQSVIVGAVDLANLNFPVFTTGGVISGTVTVNGNTLGINSGPDTGCPIGKIPLFVNAFSPASFTHSQTQVCLALSTVTASAPFQITGLANETYDLHTFLSGFQLSPPGPQRATVSGGVGSKNLVLQALTGQLDITAPIPPGDNGVLVSYQLSRDGPDSQERSGSLIGSPTATRSITGLGTGLYKLTVSNMNPGRGLTRQIPVAVTNGQRTLVTVDLTVPNFKVGGTVEIQGTVVLGSTWNVTVSSMAGLGSAGVYPELAVYTFPLPSYFDERMEPFRTVPIVLHPSSASFAVSGLTPGGYFLRVKEDANPPSPPSNCSDCRTPGQPEWASSGQVVFVSTVNVGGIGLRLTNGASLSGLIQRPPGDTSAESRPFIVRLRRTDNLTLWQTEINTSGGGSARYRFSHLGPGDYILEVLDNARPAKYTAAAVTLRIGNGDATQDIALVSAGTLHARLRDADTGTLLTAENATQFLPDAFEIAAEASPWVPGGRTQAQWSTNGPGYEFDPQTGHITIPRVLPDANHNVILRGYESQGEEARAQGRRTYAPTVIGGVKVAPGEVLDMGTIDLRQGGTLSGSVRDLSGQPLPNVRVRALPSLTNGPDRHRFAVESFSDAQGNFFIDGVDRSQRYYDLVAAPRFRSGETFAQLSGKRYGEERIRMVDVNDPTRMIGISFALEEANASLAGRVVTVDNSVLIPVFGEGKDQEGVRGADLVLHREGEPLDENPLGEIEERTSPDGAFRVEGLRPGAYTVRAIALGYSTALKAATLANGVTTQAGNIVLSKGASVSGAIVKPDGSAPSTEDVEMVVGVDEAFKDFAFGRVDANKDTGLVTGYEVSGFSAGKTYSLLIVSGKGNIAEPASGVTFESSTETKVIPLLFRPAPPKVFVNQTRMGNVFTLRFFSNQHFRNVTAADNDLAQIVTSSGPGAITSRSLSASRDTLSVTFDATGNGGSFDLNLAFTTDVVDPDDPAGDTFQFQGVFTFYTGIGVRRSVGIPNVTGGDCTLEGVPAGVSFPPGAFDVASSSSVEVGIQSADTVDELPAGAPRLAPGRAVAAMVQRLGAAAFPAGDLYQALSAAPEVDPFSPFYDVFLPAGVRRALKKEAQLTLRYADDVTDPTKINVYYFDPASSLFLLEKSGRTIDKVNKTITVGVSHLSTFVVLPSQAAILQGGAFAGGEIQVHNVPNPFDLNPKTVALTHGGSTPDLTTEGTLIKVALPTGKSGTIRVEIFDVTGALVRELTETASEGTYNYLPWDGRNAAGQKVSSGVYLAKLTLNGGDAKFFKMAVVK